MNSKKYGVLGAGMQGAAAAFDLARFGKAQGVWLSDLSWNKAKTQAERINSLLREQMVYPQELKIENEKALIDFLKPLDGALSAVPYFLNVSITKAAIEAKTHLCDLGGNTDIVFQQLSLAEQAKEAGITVVPDCGLMPGLGNIFALYAIETLDSVESVKIYCGGLPQHPKPPLNYKLVFSMEGLTNEYFGKAAILREGCVQEIDTFTELEEITFEQPIEKCEAFTTSGGTSTCPWSFQDKVKIYEYKTVRYPGHYQMMKAALDLGLLDTTPIEIRNIKISPREVFHAVVTPKITFSQDKDLVVLRAVCKGIRNQRAETLVLETIDYFDEETGFTAMERTTAFPAALVLETVVSNDTAAGVCPLEKAISAKDYLPQLKDRGISIKIKTINP